MVLLKNKIPQSIYTDLIHALPDIIYEIDLNGNFLFISNSITRWGHDPEELIGKHFSHIIDPACLPAIHREAVLTSLRGVSTGPENAPKLIDERRTGRRITRNLRVRLAHGPDMKSPARSPEFEVFSTGLYEYGRNRRKILIGTLGIMRDISEIESSRKAQYQTEKFYRLLTENSNEIITILAHDGTILFKSDSVTRIVGYEPLDLIGSNEYEYIHDEDKHILASFLEKEWSHETNLIFENRVRHRNMEWRLLESSIKRVADANGMTMCFVMNSWDVTDYARSKRRIEESARKFRTIVEHLCEVVAIINGDGEIEYASQVIEQMLGYSAYEVAGKKIFELFGPEDRPALAGKISMTSNECREIVIPAVRCGAKNGSSRIVELAVCNLLSDPYINGILINIRDVTDKTLAERAMRNSEIKYRSLYDNALVGMLTIDMPTGRILAANDLGFSLFGYNSKYGLIGEAIQDMMADTEAWKSILGELEKKGEVTHREFMFRKNGTGYFWAEITAKPYPEEGIINLVIMDVTKNKENEERIFRLKHYDLLTGLPNKNLFRLMLEKEISQSHKFALMCIGLDKFKSINNMYGTSAGDALLKAIAAKLKEVYFKKDIVARIESDRYMVLLSNIGIPGLDINLDNIDKIARKAQSIFSRPFSVDGIDIEVMTSIGMCVYPNDGYDADTLAKNCESSMYVAKEMGGNTFHYFDVLLNNRMMERLALERDLSTAIHNREFLLYYQPKVDSAGLITGLEALIRWNSPKAGIINPLEFIPLVEKNGMIIDIGRMIIEMACEQSRQWREKGYILPRIAVNLSPYQFNHRDLLLDIETILHKTGVDPQWLEIEITESGIMQNEKDGIHKLQELHRMGIAISIDDFGTGYSSLNKLRVYPLDTLKIDKSFVDSIPHDPMSSIIATTIISLGHNLGFRVIAEGVETQAQMEFLSRNLCDQFQGYLFYKPLHPDEMEKLLRRV